MVKEGEATSKTALIWVCFISNNNDTASIADDKREFQVGSNREEIATTFWQGWSSFCFRSLPVHGDGAREHVKDGGTVVVSVRMEKKQISIIFGQSHSLTHTSHRSTFSTREIWR